MSEEEDDDDAAIRRYRQKRLEELKRSSQRPPHDRIFGQVIDITIDEYPSTIDNENTLVSVAVHLYDEVSDCSGYGWICLHGYYSPFQPAEDWMISGVN